MIGIKMEMPKCCKACVLEYFDGSCIYCAFSGVRTEKYRDQKRRPDCPLREISSNESEVA